MEVCGVDPGLAITGYAILALNGESTVICDAGVCRTDADAPLTERLIQLESDFVGVLEQWNPCVMGVEQLYAHYKHHERRF